jgi:hypothetical protein
MKTKLVINTETRQRGRTFSLKPIIRKFTGGAVILFIILIIFKNPFIACTNVNSAFYNTVLNDFDTSSYYIAINIKSPFYKGRAIIENNNLYLFLHKTRHFDMEKYKDFMKSTLIHHRSLKIGEKDLATWKFKEVHEMESVIQVANRGSDNFVAHYFNGRVLNYGLTDQEQNAVINQLFYWEIPAKIDKLTGDLIIG